MKKNLVIVVIVSLLAGCAAPLATREPGAVAVVASPYEPAAQLDASSNGSPAEGAVIGAAGGAGIGAMSAKASAGLVCVVGGPLCWVVMIPAAVVGAVVGGVAGGVADAVTTDPGNRIADARGTIEQTVAEMRLTEALAAEARRRAGNAPNPTYTVEVGVEDLQFLAREDDMALTLRARAKLFRASDGALLDERVADAQTNFRKYQDWAADGAQPLRKAIDEAIARLGGQLVDELPASL